MAKTLAICVGLCAVLIWAETAAAADQAMSCEELARVTSLGVMSEALRSELSAVLPDEVVVEAEAGDYDLADSLIQQEFGADEQATTVLQTAVRLLQPLDAFASASIDIDLTCAPPSQGWRHERGY